MGVERFNKGRYRGCELPHYLGDWTWTSPAAETIATFMLNPCHTLSHQLSLNRTAACKAIRRRIKRIREKLQSTNNK